MKKNTTKPSGQDLAVEKEQGLCYRCEHRVRYIENPVSAPRYECHQTNMSVWSCYMYLPVAPVLQQVNDGDERPAIAGWMISARSHRVSIADCDLKVKGTRDGFIQYWVPTTKKNGRKKQ